MTQRYADARRELRRARLRAAQALDEAHRAAEDELDQLVAVRDSAERRWMLRQRQRLLQPASWVRHPLRSMRDVLHQLAAATGIHRLAPTFEHVLYTSSPLRAQPIAESATAQPSLADAVKWMGLIRVRGVVRHGLFSHPDSSVTWRVPVAAGARLVANCAFVPDVATKNTDGVVFQATVTMREAGWTASASRILVPRNKWLDRHWRSISVPLPATASGEAEITLSTILPHGGSADYAWSLWGEPRLVWRRRFSEITRLARAVLRRDGLRGTLRRLQHAGTVDREVEYQRWIATHTPDAQALAAMAQAVESLPSRPTISVVTPVYNTDAAWLRACIESVRQQAYPHWELCLADDASTSAETHRVLDEYAGVDPRIKIVRRVTNGHICAASNDALDLATGEFIALLDHDDELAPDALFEVARFINGHPDVDFIYSDEDKRDMAGVRSDPYFKPDWSPEHFLNFMYTNHLMVLRRSVVDAAGRFRPGTEGSQDYDLVLRIISNSDRVGHIPKVLYHWRKIPGSAAAEPTAKPWGLAAARRALEAHVERLHLDAEVLDGASPGLFRVKRRIHGNPLISIVIPTDDRSRDVDGTLVALLPHCLKSIQQRTAYQNYELVIVDNGRMSDATRDVLAGIPHRRVSYTIEGDFNFAHKLNFSVGHARGEHLVILNDDVEVISSEWLTALLEYSQDPAIGAVGAKLFYPDGRLQHIGVAMGVCGIAAHLHHQAQGYEPGYFGAALGPRNYSAVTGAVMMTRRSVFHEVGGFNEALAIDFNDIDYCLRLRKAGYRIVFTPYAELYHLESGSHGVRTWNPAEADYMKATWPEVLAADPYYNPNLTKAFPDMRIGN